MYTLASTEVEARALEEQLEALASPEFRWRNMLWMAGLDPDRFDGDEALPDEVLAAPAPTSNAERLFATARRERVPLRELGRIHGGMPTNLTFAGTPEQLAAFIGSWADAGAADGFTLMPTTLPDGLERFVEDVLPILCREGRHRREYAGRTLREHLGLPRPAGRRSPA
jgi:alkanesulfonate monooxygenase SsuD/methylene tetrahydromethanopterin reductase-like flavin-dependent oxidoreductase (luciferase family)